MPSIPRWAKGFLPRPKAYFGALAATIAWHLALLAASSWWSPGTIVVLALVPAAFLVVWAAISPVASLRRSGLDDAGGIPAQDNPVLRHMGTTVLQLVVFAAVWLLGGLWVFRTGVGVPDLLDLLPIPVLDWFIWVIVRGVLIALVALTLLAAIIQCAYLISRLSEGARSFLLGWSGLMLAWGILRALPLLSDWLSWLPELSFREFVSVGDGFELRTVYYESGPYAAAFVLVILLVVASRWLYQVVTTTAQTPGQPATSAPSAGGSTRRILALNERILIVLAALSLVFVYDVFTNNQAVRKSFPAPSSVPSSPITMTGLYPRPSLCHVSGAHRPSFGRRRHPFDQSRRRRTPPWSCKRQHHPRLRPAHLCRERPSRRKLPRAG